ncbi:Ribosome maturation factor rimP [Desulfamplus magnetovallimortis]|uniref:Ribosome maturation factor RimP n=1 Tax=Desulfamplus magnetovallimortis TaxID=1246637 RepID=A0A1W1H8T5_9BACT|nr:ribosome maturation factor RimP [Desulfamplus magnetovallimortis]SLM28844.1 Ribosome maturation factor rimP [Desulfamplus magnetovallimortis]
MGKDQAWAESVIATVKDIAEDVCSSENMEFVHAEMLSENGGATLRIYLDKPGGITIDDCIYMNRQMGDLLDVHLDDVGRYRLEISSPGPRRPLTKLQDFERFKGERAKIELMLPVDGRKRFTGSIEGVDEKGMVTLLVDQRRVAVGFDQIKKARLSGTHGE